MMRRLFWLAMGVTMGVLIMRKLSRAAERLTPHGLAQSFADGLSDLAASLRDFSADVREAMTEREAELRAGTGLDGSLGSGSEGNGSHDGGSLGSGSQGNGSQGNGSQGNGSQGKAEAQQ